MIRKLILAAPAVLVVLAVLGISVAPATVQPAEAASYTVKYKNSTTSVSSLTICKDWGDTACASGSERGYLSAGQWSHLKYPGWTDVDGFYVPGDQKATYTKLGLGRTVYGPKWVKVMDCVGCHVVVTLRWD